MLRSVLPHARQFHNHLRKNVGIIVPACQKATTTDPVQKLFVDKIREYDKKKSSAGGKLVESSPETERELKTELERIAKVFGGGPGIDMTKFPNFKFEEPKLDPVAPVQ